jgi:hypothetical protein
MILNDLKVLEYRRKLAIDQENFFIKESIKYKTNTYQTTTNLLNVIEYKK